MGQSRAGVPGHEAAWDANPNVQMSGQFMTSNQWIFDVVLNGNAGSAGVLMGFDIDSGDLQQLSFSITDNNGTMLGMIASMTYKPGSYGQQDGLYNFPPRLTVTARKSNLLSIVFTTRF